MKVATWNINSIRQRMPILTDWLKKHEPDVLCLQETKAADKDFPLLAVQATGYHVEYRGHKGLNGVATLSRVKPESVLHGLQPGEDSEDDRILKVVINGIPIVNTYVPQGYQVDSEKYVYKLAWFKRLKRYFDTHLDPASPAIWCGDLNVAPEPIDVYHPDRRVNDVDFHIDARNAWKDTAAWGFIDLFRMLHPDRVQYTYWDYFRGALKHNWGWRIDHIMATEPLAKRCRKVEVDMEPRQAEKPSDHTVVWAEFD